MKEILNNDKKLFYRVTSTEALIKAWVDLKNKQGVNMPYFFNGVLQNISKHWFETVSEKLRKGVMKYPKARSVKISKSFNQSSKRFLIIHNPKIKVIEQAFLNALEPHFEGIFESITVEKNCQKLVNEEFVDIHEVCETSINSPVFFKHSKRVSPKIFKNSSVGLRLNRTVYFALHKIKHWKTNIVFFLSCDLKKSFKKVHRNRLKNVFNSIIVDEKFWLEIQKMLNAGFVQESFTLYKDT